MVSPWVSRDVLTDLANELCKTGGIDERENFIDMMFASAKRCGEDVGYGKCGKNMKINRTVGFDSLPSAVSTRAANHHEVKLGQVCFDFFMIGAINPEIGSSNVKHSGCWMPTSE